MNNHLCWLQGIMKQAEKVGGGQKTISDDTVEVGVHIHNPPKMVDVIYEWPLIQHRTTI